MSQWAQHRDPNNGRKLSLASAFTERHKPPTQHHQKQVFGGPTEGEITAAAAEATKKLRAVQATRGIPVKVLWVLARMSLGGQRRSEVRFAVEEYLTREVTRLVQEVPLPLRQRLTRLDLDQLATRAVEQLAHQTQELTRGRRLRLNLPEGKSVFFVPAPGCVHRNCFLICDDGPHGMRVVAAQSPRQWRRSQQRRAHWDRVYHRAPSRRQR